MTKQEILQLLETMEDTQEITIETIFGEQAQAYKSFNTKEELTDYINKKLKNKNEKIDTEKKEKSELELRLKALEEKDMLNQRNDLLKDFIEDTREFIWSKLDHEKDLTKQITNAKETYKSMLSKKSSTITKLEDGDIEDENAPKEKNGFLIF